MLGGNLIWCSSNYNGSFAKKFDIRPHRSIFNHLDCNAGSNVFGPTKKIKQRATKEKPDEKNTRIVQCIAGISQCKNPYIILSRRNRLISTQMNKINICNFVDIICSKKFVDINLGIWDFIVLASVCTRATYESCNSYFQN